MGDKDDENMVLDEGVIHISIAVMQVASGTVGDRNEASDQLGKCARSKASFFRLLCPRRAGVGGGKGGGRIDNFEEA